MGLLRWIIRAAWREAGMLARILYIVAIVVPAAIPVIAGKTSIQPLDRLLLAINAFLPTAG